jgi:hypothetical protein
MKLLKMFTLLTLLAGLAFADSIPVPTTYFSQLGDGTDIGFGASNLQPLTPLPHFWQMPAAMRFDSGQIDIDYSNAGNGYIGLDLHNSFLFGNCSDVTRVLIGGSWYLMGMFSGEEFISEGGNKLALYDVSGTFDLYAGGAPGQPGYVRLNGSTYAGQTLTTPEPGTLLMFGTGLVMLGGMARRKIRC